MRCWKCKSEMPEGLKYCGNCGVHMNRMVHTIQWLFSKKGLPVLILLIALILGLIAWAVFTFVDFPQPDLDLPAAENPFDSDDPLEKMYDFGLCPDEGSFIAGNTLDGGIFQNKDIHTYIEGGTINFSLEYNDALEIHEYIISGEHPNWWSHYVFASQLEKEVNDYLEILDDKPFYFELVHQQTFESDDEYNDLAHFYYHDAGEYYFYRYTGVQNTFGLNLPGWMEEDLGEINLIIRILEDADGIHVETWQDLGLESIYREEMEDILNDVPYHRVVDDRIVTDTEPAAAEPVETEPVETEPVETEPAATEPPADEPALDLMLLPNFLDSCKEGEYTLTSATDYYTYTIIGFRGQDMTCEYAAEAYVRELEKLGYTLSATDQMGSGNWYGYKWYLSSAELPENELKKVSPCHVYVQVIVDTEFNTCSVEIHVMMGIEMDGITAGAAGGEGDGDCWTCSGDGRCDDCGGDGKVMEWLPGTREYVEVNCTSCNNGSCRDCGGDGDN